LVLESGDRLEGGSNITPWKYNLYMLLEEVELRGFVEKEVIVPTKLVQFANYKKKEAKS
jgi:hypothetical protein